MTNPLRWRVLRRAFNACAVAVALMVGLLGVWQFLVPGESGSMDVVLIALIGAFAVCVPSGLVLAVSSSRSLWRAQRQGVSWLPLAVLALVVFGLPGLANATGLGPGVVLWSIPLAFFLSGVCSVCAILVTRAPDELGAHVVPADSMGDEPAAYARDVVVKGKKPGRGTRAG